MLTRYQRLADSGHPLTEAFAEQLYSRTRPCDWPEGMQREGVWERDTVEVREAFRDRARRFMEGDLTVMPWTYPIGMVGRPDNPPASGDR